MTASDLLALSGERDTWLRRLLAAERGAYRAGYAAGRDDERRDADRAWAARPAARAAYGPSLAEVEAARWQLRGEQRTRATFGSPHQADFTGRAGSEAAA